MNYLQILIKNKIINKDFKLQINYLLKDFDIMDSRYLLFCDGSGGSNIYKKGSYSYVLYDCKYEKYINAEKEDSVGNFFENELNALYNGINIIKYINDITYIFIDNLKLYHLITDNKTNYKISKLNKIKVLDIKNILFENEYLKVIKVDRKYVKPADWLNNLK